MPRERDPLQRLLDTLARAAADAADDWIKSLQPEKTTWPNMPHAPRARRVSGKAPKVKKAKVVKPAKRERSVATHYETLQVARTADTETISAAYRSLCKRAHPDNWPSAKDEHRRQAGEFRMKLYTEAFAVLKDPIKRREYDRSIQ
jgi:DnaJ-domain-containing protein 1